MKGPTSVAAILFAAIMLGPIASRADVVIPFGDATGTGPWNLSSTASTYSGVDVELSTPFTFGALSSLGATFTDNSGGADGGSPRIVLTDNANGDFFTIYLGTPPNFNDSSPATFTSNFSGLNLNNGTANSAFENSGSYVTLASLLANLTYSGDLIDEIDFIVDGGWAANGTQNLDLDSLNINGASYVTSQVSEVPEPSTLALLATMLALGGGLAFLTRRPRVTSSSTSIA